MAHNILPDRSPSSGNPEHNPYAPPPPPSADAKARRRKRLVRYLLIPAAALALAVMAGVVAGAMIKKPEVEELASFEHRLVTQLHDESGEVFRSYSRENRILIAENELPDLLAKAIIAAEDGNFYEHGGVDLKGILRAAWTNFRAGKTEEGASTITMQVARQVFLHRRREWKRKIEEAFLAVELEKRYSKQQILTLWANLQNLGHGNYGMEAAARDYFNKSVQDLSLAEAATLAGIPNRPSYFAIRTRPEAVKERRNYVLRRMLDEEFIDREAHDAAIEEPVLVVRRRRQPEVGPYFAEEVRRYISSTYGTTALYDRGLQIHTTLDRQIQEAAEGALRQGLLRLDHMKGWRGAKEHFDEGEADAEAGALEERRLPSWIGLDPIPGPWYEGIVLESDARRARVKIENQVYELGREGIEWTRQSRPDRLLERGDVAWFRLALPEDADPDDPDAEPFLVLEQEPELEGAVLVIESATGAVRAMVGGWDYQRNEFNRATQAQRQVGSAFKVFVFGAALENGFTAADTIFDGPAMFLGADNTPSYSPRNYYRQYYGITTLSQALAHSYNVTAVKLLDMVGVEQVIDLARRCGIQSELPPYPSLALGSADLVPLELAAAYATIANGGIYVEPYLIEKVLSNSGRAMQEHMPQAHQAMDPRQAYVLNRMLRRVATSGTGAGGQWGLARIDVEAIGKTGTTNSYTDAWFVGATPKYTLLSWVGYDQKRPIGRGMTGAAAALPIWTTVLKSGLEDGWIVEGETFPVPPGIVKREIEATTGLLPGPGAPRIIEEFFVEGNEPEQKFNQDLARVIALPWYLQEPFYLPKEGEKMPSQIEDWTLVREAWAAGRPTIERDEDEAGDEATSGGVAQRSTQ